MRRWPRRSTSGPARCLPHAARRAGCDQADGARLRRRPRPHACCAAATRAWTSACIEARGARRRSRIGDYVLSGGELAAMVLLDACVRLLPGVMGAAESGAEESFAPACWNTPTTRGRPNGRAARCRRCCSPATTPRSRAGARREAERITRERRPDLWARYTLMPRRRGPWTAARPPPNRSRKGPDDEHAAAVRGGADGPPPRRPRRAGLRAGRHACA